MNIVGIGIDICKNSRIEKLIFEYGNKFLYKVFHQKEIDYCIERYKNIDTNYFAKRFAAKEAFVKAIGVGFNGHVKKNEIAILNDIKYCIN
jgi:holo-[acyl-carrier protein] synthase